MKKGRLEAFSDGVLAIVITIMVLGLTVPGRADFAALKPLLPKFTSYLLSFIYVGIYWTNHHHMFQAIEKVNGKVLWANLGLLFVLSLLPFTTAWMGENHFARNPVSLYGLNLLLCATAYSVLEKAVLQLEGRESRFGRAIKGATKENLSIVIYVVGTVVAFFAPLAGVASFVVVALMWIIPDRRIEKSLE